MTRQAKVDVEVSCPTCTATLHRIDDWTSLTDEAETGIVECECCHEECEIPKVVIISVVEKQEKPVKKLVNKPAPPEEKDLA